MSLQGFVTRVIWWCLLPLILLGIVLAADHLLTRRSEQLEQAENSVRATALAVDNWLRARQAALLVLARSSVLAAPMDLHQLYAEAEAFREHFGGQVLLFDASETALLSTRAPLGSPLPAVSRPEGRSALREALTTLRPAMGDLFLRSAGGERQVALAVPVLRDSNAPLALVHSIEAGQFASFLESQPLAHGARLRLLDSTGAVIASRGADPVEASIARFEREAITAIAPWRVQITMTHADFAAPLWRTGSALAALLIASALVGVLGGAWAGRRLSRELQTLTGGPASAASHSRIGEIAAAGHRLEAAMAEREDAEAARRETDRQAREEIERASLNLQVREAQLRGIFDSASDAIITIDDEQKILMANPSAAAMFGIPQDSLIGSNLAALLPERFRAAHAADIRAFGGNGVSARHMGQGKPLSAVRANGEEFPIDAAISRAHVDGQRLFTVILRDVTERERTQHELRASRTELQASHAALQRLVAAQDRIQEAERRRIARELHDDLQQTLAAIVIEVAALRGELRSQGAAEMLDRVDALAASAIDSTRRIVHDLRPQTLEELGLVPALKALASGFARQTGIACEVSVADALRRWPSPPDEIATCLYRVAQEALNNVAKHAQAHRVHIGLSRRAADDGLVMSISDDGRGMSSEDRTRPQGFGLVGMRERVLAIGGGLRIGSAPGNGTRLQVEVPPARDG